MSPIKYHMKVAIQGHRGTGKTCLWRRFQDLPFTETYTPTLETQTCGISWSYKASDDLVHVDILDVAEKGRDGADTESQDVNAVILMVDPSKPFTFEFAKRSIGLITEHTDVLILSNFRDLGDKRVVSESEIREWISTTNQNRTTPNVHFLETSMHNRYGTKTIASFLNLPYVRLQRAILEEKLKLNLEEMTSVEKELALLSKEQNYEFYLKWLEQTTKNKGTRNNTLSNLKNSSADASKTQTSTTATTPVTTTPPPANTPAPRSVMTSSQTAVNNPSSQPKDVAQNKVTWQPPVVQQAQPVQKKGFFSETFQ